MSIDKSGIVQPGNYVICTAGTRPASPYTGQMIYQTDTEEFFIYDGSAWVVIVSADDNVLTWTGL